MNPDTNIADLFRQLRDDVLALMSEEVALAKTEVTEKLTYTGRNIGYLAVGGLIASTALTLILMAVGFLLGDVFAKRGFDPGVATFFGFLIVALIVGAISAVLISKALKSLSADTIKPEKTVQSLREDKQWAQNKLSS